MQTLVGGADVPVLCETIPISTMMLTVLRIPLHDHLCTPQVWMSILLQPMLSMPVLDTGCSWHPTGRTSFWAKAGLQCCGETSGRVKLDLTATVFIFQF